MWADMSGRFYEQLVATREVVQMNTAAPIKQQFQITLILFIVIFVYAKCWSPESFAMKAHHAQGA